MLRDARGHRFSLILTVRLDRIARSMVNFHDMLKDLNQSRVRFHCVDQPEISTDTSTGKLVMGILGYVAQFERDLIRDRTKAGLYRARAQGVVLGRPKTGITWGEVVKYRESGRSLEMIARDLGVSVSTIRRALKKEGANPALKKASRTSCSNTDDFDSKGGP